MHILGFETTGPIGSVATMDLITGEIRMKVTEEPMSHLKHTAVLAEELMTEIGGPSELAAVAASIGPGSFTGIRIGVTMARAISQALNIPAISVPTLEVFREHCNKLNLKDPGLSIKPNTEARGGLHRDDSESVIAAILNARRGQVYGAVFDRAGGAVLKPGPYMLTDFLEITDRFESAIFFGDGIDSYYEILSDMEGENSNGRAANRIFAPEEERYQTADLVVKIAKDKYEKGETLEASELTPDYMRLAEAEQRLRDGTLRRRN